MPDATGRPLVALISATPASIAPATAAFAEVFPEAVLWNLLDDRLLPDAEAQGGVSPALSARMDRLIDHALIEGADAVLLTCSLYGPTAAAREVPGIPLLPPDAAAFAELLTSGHTRVLVVASNSASLQDSQARLRGRAAAEQVQLTLEGAIVPGAVASALAGDRDLLIAELLAVLRPALNSAPATEAVLLAQYSLAPAAQALAAALGLPVLSGPSAAADRLRRQIAGVPA